MKSWKRPDVPRLPGSGTPPRLWNTASRAFELTQPNHVASLYVCGITPYDATHIGHAATYLAYDTLVRAWRDGGFDVSYVQNVTDVDDPLLERAAATGADWRELAASQIALFRHDMESLRIIPPDEYIGVTEVVTEVADAVRQLINRGLAYLVPAIAAPTAPVNAGANDIYFDIAAATSNAWRLGDASKLSLAEMLPLFAERGGDPSTPGKRDPLDPLVWRAARVGEPAWSSVVGAGRPGWHIECSVIAQTHLPMPLTVNGGGSDLAFPHHEYSAGHTAALTGHALAEIYSHAGMVSFEGAKMSKSLGNLVFVSGLVAAGADARAIRLALLAQHYRSDWEWTAGLLEAATARLVAWDAWASAASSSAGPDATDAEFIESLREAIADDLQTPRALRVVDARAASGPASPDALRAIDALLGVALTRT